MDPRRKSEMIAVVLISFAIFIFLSIFSFSAQDMRFYTSDPNFQPVNLTGIYGSYVGFLLRFVAGAGSYVIPFVLLIWGIARLSQNQPRKVVYKVLGAFFLIVGISASLSLTFADTRQTAFARGGLIGSIVSDFLLRYLGEGGTVVFIVALVTLSALIATEFMILPVFSVAFVKIKKAVKAIPKIPLPTKNIRQTITGGGLASNEKQRIKHKLEQMRKEVDNVRRTSLAGYSKEEGKTKKKDLKIVDSRKRRTSGGSETAVKPGKMKVSLSRDEETDYILPRVEILREPSSSGRGESESALKERSLLLERTLLEFGVEASVVKINRGPVITMYELEPAIGTKVNKITSLSDNISLAMKSSNIRIVAPLPGKGTIGVEVPNKEQEQVVLRSILQSPEYQQESSPLKIALGKDLSGQPMVADLAGMPHLLIAGATGSGKTVCINTIICSMLFNASPEELKLLLVDPKRVELMIFEGLPHLVCPIVTKAKNASTLLNWVVEEMDRRYKIFSEKGVRNIASYKDRQECDDENLPYMVLVVDELADLMMVGKQDVEESIMRIAQLSRAAGIHMILATQRPSVNVITGVIKANFPARISFKVTSKVDSRTVLDSNGAEKLLGKGDMLLMQPGDSSLLRGQCSLVEDSEIRRLVKQIKQQAPPEYNEEVFEKSKKSSSSAPEKRDDRYEEAVRMVLGTKQASVSMIQRRLRIGYTRAARMIDTMEMDGIVGPYNGSKPRDIIVENIEDVEGIE